MIVVILIGKTKDTFEVNLRCFATYCSYIISELPNIIQFTSADFVKEVILAVAKNFNTEEAADLEVVLPEALKKDLESFVTKELAKALKGNIEASFSKKIAGGFTIGPKDGGYFISFTEETFNALISEYLRPATKKILFG